MGIEASFETDPVICVRPEFLLSLLEEIGRNRALADHETDLIEDIVNMGMPCFRWNPRTDRALLLAANTAGGIARFARRYGISGGAAYQRLTRLRRRHGRQMGAGRRKG